MMRLFKVLTVSLLVILTVFVAVIESGPGQRFMQKKLIETLKEDGIGLEADVFGGHLPETMDLRGASIHYEGKTIKVDHLFVEIALFPLLQKKIAIEKFIAEGVQFKDAMFNLDGKLELDWKGQGSLSMNIEGPFKGAISLHGSFDQFTGKASGFYRELSFQTNLSKQDDTIHLTDAHVVGYGIETQGSALIHNEKLNAAWELRASIGNKPLTSSGSVEGVWGAKEFQGIVQAEGEFFQEKWTLNTPLLINEMEGIGVRNFQLHSSLFEGTGNLFWNGGLSGELDLSSLDNFLKIDFNNKIWSSSLTSSHTTAELKGHWQKDRVVLDEASGEYLDLFFHIKAPAFIGWEPNGRITSGRLNISLSNDASDEIGQTNVNLSDSRVVLNSNLSALSMNLDIPVYFTLWPFEIKLLPELPASAQVSIHGKIEEILDFFHLGMHRLAGDVSCDMTMKGTLSFPEIVGSCKIENGDYENYLTGTELTSLSAEIVGKGSTLSIASFSAKDAKKKGNFTISGNILASLPDYFPFHLKIDFTRMNIVQIDLIEAEAEGHLLVDGDLRSALAKGHIEIVEAEITIPDKIPRSYPDLPYISKGAKEKGVVIVQPKKPYPLNLEIEIDAPEAVFIDGRGLHSEWHGHFSVGGTFTNPSAIGKLELQNGEFVFVGRRFKLHEGTLSLKGKAYEMPNINIAGTTSEKGISITAHLAGPLNKPQITFQSSPPLPISGILSYLLFGQDLSEVSGIQALQLAGTIATFAGEGPDILELTRKSLGVDRLQIVMTPGKTEGEETIALQVGKIVFPGFLVSIKQGADDSSPNIAIEVDLTHGFTFEAESEQQPAQGKFSILWNLNY